MCLFLYFFLLTYDDPSLTNAHAHTCFYSLSIKHHGVTARTGLSATVAGIFFLCSLPFGPFFGAILDVSTTPLLIMVGILCFQNVKRIDFSKFETAIPAFCVLLFIPFTSSTIAGCGMGYAMYLLLNLFTGSLWESGLALCEAYFPGSTTGNRKAQRRSGISEAHSTAGDIKNAFWKSFGPNSKFKNELNAIEL